MFNKGNDLVGSSLSTAQKKEMQAESAMISSLFSSEQGQLVLKKLIDKFVDVNIARPNDDMLTIGIRQGQANIVKYIEKQINISKGK